MFFQAITITYFPVSYLILQQDELEGSAQP